VGVDLFFVLSGYVVLSVVITEIDGTGGFNIQRFYARRVRRLLPAAIFLIVSICLIWVAIGSVLDRAEFVDDMRASVLYFANWHFISESTDYFGESVSPFAHFWSLALEEQFYILMPLLVAGITMKYLRSWRQVLLWSSLAVCVLSVVLQIRFSSSYPSQHDSSSTIFRLVARRKSRLQPRPFRRMLQQPLGCGSLRFNFDFPPALRQSWLDDLSLAFSR
jgi:peptidoglycan/LPS O-acetylase OafA/YrhL